ncbi:hypothetical protein CsSME_00014134 [Camellia sinensis var. sinensis]
MLPTTTVTAAEMVVVVVWWWRLGLVSSLSLLKERFMCSLLLRLKRCKLCSCFWEGVKYLLVCLQLMFRLIRIIRIWMITQSAQIFHEELPP